MMDTKLITNESEYEKALAEIEALMALNPRDGAPDSDRLGILSLLVGDFESRTYPIDAPDPIEAIKFRMAQQGLKTRDLVPYIGSRSKVSEVLRRKRSLSLSMIRALHEGLGIPAAVLIQEGMQLGLGIENIEWDQFPLKEMAKRGWFEASDEVIREEPRSVMLAFFEPLGSLETLAVMCRKTNHVRSARKMDEYALVSWTARVLIQALQADEEEIERSDIGLEFIQNLVKLSVADNGPLLAKEFLRANGIQLIIEPHLSGTYLDGATIFALTASPVIGLTIRYDRLDNFWFTLIHELAHIALHDQVGIEGFYDDLDVSGSENRFEIEADELASEALIPQEIWERSPASMVPSAEAVEHLSKELSIHPAIIAGRIRFELKSYKILSQFVGYNQVRRQFSDISWGEGND